MKRTLLNVALASALSLAATQSFADVKAGEAVFNAGDCKLCHAVDKQLVGPSYKDVAAKYKGADKATIAKLAAKIKAGGSGVWGKNPMTPHPALSDKELTDVVEWVLSH